MESRRETFPLVDVLWPVHHNDGNAINDGNCKFTCESFFRLADVCILHDKASRVKHGIKGSSNDTSIPESLNIKIILAWRGVGVKGWWL